MKRILTLLLVTVIFISALAEKQTSVARSFIVQKTETIAHDYNCTAKFGIGALFDTSATYNIGMSYQQQFSKYLFWGGQIGSCLTTVNYGGARANIYLSPLIGIKKQISNRTRLEASAGLGYERAFHINERDANRIFWQLGPAISYRRMLYEIVYHGSVGGGGVSSAIIFNVGFRF